MKKIERSKAPKSSFQNNKQMYTIDRSQEQAINEHQSFRSPDASTPHQKFDVKQSPPYLNYQP